MLVLHLANGETRQIDCDEDQSVLDVLQQEGIAVLAPCGGNGTCGRCNVLVRDKFGVEQRLACQTRAVNGTEVILEDIGSMKIAGWQDSACAPCSEATRFGIAIDIGTTTMVLHLVDLDTGRIEGSLGKVNPQASFGADVIARINASTLNGLDILSATLANGINQAAYDLCERFGVSPEAVEEVAMVGNTTMEHFAAGFDPSPIGVSPFTPRSLFGEKTAFYNEKHIRKAFPPFERTYFAPALAGYVGGDITAGMLASDIAHAQRLHLFVDIGTNGEIALGNKDRIVTCATAAGPAFEGASITFGMPAMPGAISSVQWEGDALKIETIDDKTPLGLCGSGILDAVACLLEREIVDETGYMNDEDEVAPALANLLGEESGQTVCYLDEARQVFISQEDIRKMQLAKAAIRAGIETLMREFDASYDDIDGLILAGGFGMHLRPAAAATLGLLPPALEQRIIQVGNAAGQGAVLLLSEQGKQAVAELASRCSYLELSACPTFNALYIEEMSFEND